MGIYSVLGGVSVQSLLKPALRRRQSLAGWGFPKLPPINEESRLLYLVIQLMKNHPAVSSLSPTKTATNIRLRYKTICDRIMDDPLLSTLNLPLPNINSKSITNFISKQETKYNLMSTAQPKVVSHRRVISF